MKKPAIFFAIILAFSFTAAAETPTTSDWYQYNGYSGEHSFAVRFPTDWKVGTLGDDTQGFTPAGDNDNDSLIEIKEFENQTFDQVISYFAGDNSSFLKSEDQLLKTPSEDLVAKKTYFLNKVSGESTEIILIKRGSLIIAISKNSDKFADVQDAIVGTFNFTDNWYQYLNLNEGYSVIFPTDLTLVNLSDGVQIVDKDKKNIFTLRHYKDTDTDDAIDEAEENDENYLSSKKINFHGIDNVTEATYKKGDSEFSRIIIEKTGNAYSLTNFDYEDVPEILESFEFFEISIEDNYFPYKHFPDIRDNHQNAEAINTLVGRKVINGYPDGTFKPDGEINRAELTKMIVTTKINPDKKIFKNCFPDVEEQWYAPYVCYARAKGWVEGYPDGTFGPEKNVNRAEALKIILGVMFKIPEEDKLKDTTVKDIDQQDWYAKYFIFADNNNLLDKQHIEEKKGGYYYYPQSNMSRKEVAETIFRAGKLK